MATIDQLYAKLQTLFADRIERSEVACGEITLEIPAQHLRDISLELRDNPELDFKLLIDVCGVDYLHYGISEWETRSTTFTGFSRGVEINPHPAAHAGNPPVFKGGDDLSDGAIPPANTDNMPLHPTRVDSSPENQNTSNPVDSPLPPFEKGKGRFGKHRFASVYHLLSLTQNHRLRLRVFMDADNLQVPSVTDIWPAANWFERESFDLFGILYVGHPDLRRILTDYGFVGHPFRKDFPLIGNVEARYDAKTQRVVYEAVSIKPRILEPKVIRDDNRYNEGGV